MKETVQWIDWLFSFRDVLKGAQVGWVRILDGQDERREEKRNSAKIVNV